MVRKLLAGIGIVISLALAGCHGYQVHPGSINMFDSVTADTLAGVQATLDNARAQLKAGTLPPTLKPTFTQLAKAYNTALASYKTYRDLARAGEPVDVTALNTDMKALADALATYTNAGGK